MQDAACADSGETIETTIGTAKPNLASVLTTWRRE